MLGLKTAPERCSQAIRSISQNPSSHRSFWRPSPAWREDGRNDRERLCGAAITTAASAAEGFEQLQTPRPAVLVSDIDTPGEGGRSLIRGNARYADRINALAAGYQVHLQSRSKTMSSSSRSATTATGLQGGAHLEETCPLRVWRLDRSANCELGSLGNVIFISHLAASCNDCAAKVFQIRHCSRLMFIKCR